MEYYDKQLASEIYKIRQHIFTHKKQIGKKPAAFWFAPENIGGKIGTGLSLVLETRGCFWALSKSGGCSMCGYVSQYVEGETTKDILVSQLNVALDKLKQKPAPYIVKIYTSGSFLDPQEVPIDAKHEILKILEEISEVEEIVLESRPEFVKPKYLQDIVNILKNKKVEIAIGLESSNELVRVHSINKGFTNNLYKKAVQIARSFGLGVRSYILFKPLFLSEREAIEDAIKSIEFAISAGSTTISLNPMNIQTNTLVEKVWRNGSYRLPWLWSVVEVLERTAKYRDHVRFDCDPTAAGKERGVHNCGRCDAKVLEAIRNYALHQNPEVFSNLHCNCKKIWEYEKNYEMLIR